jgi:hypothetical protein
MLQPSEGYLLLEEVHGKVESKRFLFGSKTEDVVLRKGDLFRAETFTGSKEVPCSTTRIGNYIAVNSFTPPLGRCAVLPKRQLATLSETQLLLLCSLLDPSDRIRAYEDGRLEEAERLAVHSTVTVSLPKYPDPTPGVVWFVGRVDSMSEGYIFGVELLSDPARGQCDGTFQGQRYFNCLHGCGVFVTFDKLRLCNGGEDFTHKVSAFCVDSDDPLIRLKNIRREIKQQGLLARSRVAHEARRQKMTATPDGRLELGMAVAVFEDNGLKFDGRVRWLGTAKVYTEQSFKQKKTENKEETLLAGIEVCTHVLSSPVIILM